MTQLDIANSRLHDIWSKYKWVTWSPVKAIISVVPNTNELVATIEDEIIGSDLNISPLDDASRLKPLAGFSTFQTSDGTRIFPEGFSVSFTISHNEMGRETILLREMTLVVEHYDPSIKPEYQYALEGENVIGAGIIQPWSFYVEIEGDHVLTPYLALPNIAAYMRARPENFFQTDRPQLLSFSKNEQFIQEIYGTVKTRSVGLYKLRLCFRYNVGGRKDIAYFTHPIMVYNQQEVM